MRYRSFFRSLCMVFVFTLLVSTALAQVDITTWQGSLQHTGLNSSETALTPANVGASGSFGLLFTQQTDGQTYGQPLYVSSNTLSGLPGSFSDGKSHNVVYVATEAGSLYAFDADADLQVVNPNGTNSSPLWHANLIPSGSQPVPQTDVQSSDILGDLAITTTPVIDTTTGTIYIVVKIKNPAVNPPYQQLLYALDLKTGNPKFGGPVLVNPSFTGIPPNIAAGDLDPVPSPGPNKIPFSPLHEHTRAAMVLFNGVVYISYASHSDQPPYYGEILGYDATTLQLVKTFITTPNNTAEEAGIWQSGAGPAIDAAGNMYIVTGNGTLDHNTSPSPSTSDFGESVLKLPTNTTGEIGLAFSDTTKWFTPNNWASLGDQDLGAGSVLLLPDQTQGTHPHIMVGGGKAGILYVLDRDNLGGVNPNDSSAIQEIVEPGGHQLFLTPAYFNGNIYYAPSGGHLEQRQVQFDPTTGNYVSPTAISSTQTYGNRGTSVFISGNGTSNGIVWILSNALTAYDATNVTNPVFTANAVLPTQGGGTCTTTKFSLPIVVNGKAYYTCYNAQTNVGYLQVSGLFPTQAGSPPAPSNTTAAAKSASQITVSWTNNATSSTGFNFLIKRSTSANGTFTTVGTVPANVTTFTDSELNSSTAYFYEIVASNGANSFPSNVASATTFPTYSTPGLVAYWNMDDGSSTNNTSCAVNVFDVSGNGHSGTSCGEAAFTAVGYINGGWVFHGTTALDRIVVPNNSALQFGVNQSFTLSAWIEPVALKGVEQTIIAKSADQGNEYGIYINAASEWVARGPSGDLVGPAAALNTWTHVALVQDGTAGTRSLYVNGVLEASGPAQAADGAGDLWMGEQNTSTVEGYQGLLDEVRLYNLALTPEQVTDALASPVIDVVSSQTQGHGTFGITLFPAPAPQTEPRIGSVPGTYNLVLHFAAPVTGITASLGVQPGIAQPAVGQVSSVTYDSTNTVVTVGLTGVQDIQALNLHLDGIRPTTTGASIAGTADIPFDILQGDVTGDHVVNQFDVAGVQAHLTNQVSQNNFIYDLNGDGAVNTSDANLITGTLNGHSLPVQTDASLALFKNAFSSTNNGGNVQGNAFDNNTNTRWESVQGAAADPSWIYVDLGAPANVHSIAINWENASANVYDLQWSNDATNWNEIVNIPNNPPGARIVTSGPLNFPAARYIRMFGTKRNTTFGYSIFEFQVFGSFAQSTAAPTITSPLTATGTVGTAFSYQITASQNPNNFGATSLPAGLSVSSSGLISGTPTTAGTSAVTISASNGTGTGSATLNLTINNPSIPQPPAGLTAVAGNGQITLSWAASTGATSYSVFRGTASGAEGTTPFVGNLTGTNFVDTSVTVGTTYFYFVKAANGAGSSSASNEVSGTPTAAIPATPSNLTALAGNAQITLNWNASTGATSYNVYRGTTAGGESATPIATGITATSFVNTLLTNGTTYFYKVAAANSAGTTSALSNEASATPQQPQTGAVVYQINAGGPAVAPFVADEFFTSGGESTTTNTVSTAGVANAAPMAVYQSYRRGGGFTYTLPGLTPGASYTVRLHFAETFWPAAGNRQFNVAINGTPVLTNFDIFKTAGAQNKAVVETFTATADSSGQIAVAFTTGAADLPRLNGLELLAQ